LHSSRPIAILLLFLGIILWLSLTPPHGPGWYWPIPLLAAAIGFIPPINRSIGDFLDRISHPSPRRRCIASVAVASFASLFFFGLAIIQGRDFYPKFHDEFSYLIQTQMVARGRLWMPALAIPRFFESPYLILTPVYASMYFPGTAILNAPAVWLHLPTWLIPIFCGGACVGLIYRVMAELIDGSAAILAALLALSAPLLDEFSLKVMGQIPVLLMGLLALWAFLRWRTSPRLPWMLLIGALAGWAAITRPVDAVCLMAPIGLAIVLALIRDRRLAPALALLVAGAVPFLAVQALLNQRVTGSVLTTPFTYYTRQNYPGMEFGSVPFHQDGPPNTTIRQKLLMYDQFVAQAREQSTPHGWFDQRIGGTLNADLPQPILLILLPLGILGLGKNHRWVVALALPLFIAIYGLYPLFFRHYAIAMTPAITLLVVSAYEGFSRPIRVAVAFMLIAAAGVAMAKSAAILPANLFPTPNLEYVNLVLPSEVYPPAVVLFNFPPGVNPDEEPVYNAGVATPDEAPIIFAHDFADAPGGEDNNRAIYQYYAKLDPNRQFWRFDRASNTLTRLGTAAQMAADANGK
jgi:4-amino-4-deoxy-L-arabinose transferase-like glycosyltransferase